MLKFYKAYKKMTWLAISICVLAVVGGVGSKYLLNGKEDNPIEELAEDIIEKHTGLAVDLSPSSPEKKR